MSVTTLPVPRILERPEHPISRKNIERNAIKVLYRLHNSGFLAYLVGGSVRDLMLGREPKDFDVGTDARPNEIRRLFRNSRVIGRRFRLVHVFFHDGIVEVSTFRRDPDPSEQEREPGELLITSDNTFGTPEEDAVRRDFTINALFYSIADFSVIDYVGGIEDLERRLIRVIGEPEIRFREDPVRMLRACEFAGRLDFEIEERTRDAIRANCEEIAKAAPARLTEELMGLLGSGHAAPSFDCLLEQGLLDPLLPEARAVMRVLDPEVENLRQLLAVVDRMVGEGRQLGDPTLLAVLLVPGIDRRRLEIERLRGRPMSRSELAQLVEEDVEAFRERFALSNLKTRRMSEALTGFQRLCEPRPACQAQRRIARQPWFEDALLIFEILVDATGAGHGELARWAEVAREVPRREERQTQRPRRRRRRRRRRPRRGS